PRAGGGVGIPRGGTRGRFPRGAHRSARRPGRSPRPRRRRRARRRGARHHSHAGGGGARCPARPHRRVLHDRGGGGYSPVGAVARGAPERHPARRAPLLRGPRPRRPRPVARPPRSRDPDHRRGRHRDLLPILHRRTRVVRWGEGTPVAAVHRPRRGTPGGRFGERHDAVLGGGRAHEGRLRASGIDREPAQIRPGRPPPRPRPPRPRGDRRRRRASERPWTPRPSDAPRSAPQQLDWAMAFSTHPLPAGDRVAVLANSGTYNVVLQELITATGADPVGGIPALNPVAGVAEYEKALTDLAARRDWDAAVLT